MEKRIWSKPEMHEFAFAANEYVAACGDQNKVYKFVCDAAEGILNFYNDILGFGKKPGFDYDENGDLIKPNNWNDYYSTQLGSYHPCDSKHEASVTDDFYWGFVDYNNNGKHDSSDDEKDETVIVWLGEWGNFGHATKNLNTKTWETAKS